MERKPAYPQLQRTWDRKQGGAQQRDAASVSVAAGPVPSELRVERQG